MNEAAIRGRLMELAEILTNLPGQGKAAKSPTGGLYLPSCAAGRELEDCLDQLRLFIKYVIFDLEATRRENRYLRQMLEARFREDAEDAGGSDK